MPRNWIEKENDQWLDRKMDNRINEQMGTFVDGQKRTKKEIKTI